MEKVINKIKSELSKPQNIYSDLGDIGNIIGIAIAHFIDDENSIEDFCDGLNHGVSLVDRSHDQSANFVKIKKRYKLNTSINKNKGSITIMADFGDAVFWDKDGVCIGSRNECGMYDNDEYLADYPLLSEFLDDLYKWHIEFEQNAYSKNNKIDWDTFNKKGLELSKRFKVEMQIDKKMYYRKPYEDPNHSKNEITLIE